LVYAIDGKTLGRFGDIDQAQFTTRETYVSPPVAWGSPQYGADFAAADFNGDHHVDLAVTGSSDYAISVFLNDGTSLFSNAATYGNFPSIAEGLVVGDFNGTPDIFVTFLIKGGEVWLGQGDGTFKPAPNYMNAWTTAVQGGAVADFTHDGKDDLVAVMTAADSTSFAVFTDVADSVFTGGATYDTSPPGLGYNLIAGDFNHDGWPDFATACWDANSVEVFFNQGDGTFAPPQSFGTGIGPSDMAVADFNGDGRLDLAVSNQNDNSVSVLLSACLPPSEGGFDEVGFADDADSSADRPLDL
jgi:hypothetical protein